MKIKLGSFEFEIEEEFVVPLFGLISLVILGIVALLGG